ncbi:hypothetical protein VNO77_34663 [Canavalia gladiata]|uniref:Uncharacterized protein n=1 Tax=Canavalia gladiata TaxID=3824 RepID=A0AAN9KEJ7_CANGL
MTHNEKKSKKVMPTSGIGEVRVLTFYAAFNVFCQFDDALLGPTTISTSPLSYPFSLLKFQKKIHFRIGKVSQMGHCYELFKNNFPNGNFTGGSVIRQVVFVSVVVHCLLVLLHSH